MSRLPTLLLATFLPVFLLFNFFDAFQIQADTTSMFTVNNTTDIVDVNPGDGICETSPSNAVCTLRAAIQEANANPGLDTIVLPSAIYTLTLNGAQEDQSAAGDLDIVDDLIIAGDNSTNTVIDGNNIDRVFHITGTTAITVTFSQVTIQNGNTILDNAHMCGGGILLSSNNATVNITGTVLFRNQSTTCGHGISNEGTLIVENSQFSENSVIGGGGGTLHNTGNLSIKNSTFSDNNSYGGGGVFNEGTATLEDVNIVNNLVYLDGGGIYNSGSLTITGGMVATNTVNTTRGGAIYNASGILVVENVLIQNNSVPIQDGGFDTSGGGIYVETGQATLSYTTFVSNRAEFGGAIANKSGKMLITNSNIFSNTAANGGGGIINEAEMILMNSSVISNVAVTEDGGGILNLESSALVTVTNTTIGKNLSGGDGGAVNNQVSGAVWLNNVTIAENNAQNGDGVFNGGSTFSVENSLIAYHLGSNCSGTLNSVGHNLDDDGSCHFSGSGDIDNQDPLLAAIDFDSLNTWTYRLNENSPALDAGDDSSCSEIDQLFTKRPLDGDMNGTAVCDIGAYEAVPVYKIVLPIILK